MKGPVLHLSVISILSVLALSWGGIFYGVLTEQGMDQRYRFLCYACGMLSSCFLAWGVWSGRAGAWYASMGLQIFIVVVPHAIWSDAPMLNVWLIFLLQFAAAVWGGRSTPILGTISDIGFDKAGEKVVTRSWLISWLRNAALLFSALLIGLLLITLTSIIAQDDVPLWAVAILSLLSLVSLAYLASVRH